MTPEQIRLAAEEAARDALDDILSRVGIDTRDHIETQKDMHYLRGLRTTVGDVANKLIMLVLGSMLTGIIAVLVVGARAYLTSQ